MAANQPRALQGFLGEDHMTRQKAETIRIAQEQQAAITEKLKRNDLEFPKFSFLELIGKGTFGRVFKANDLLHDRMVAVKVIDVDSQDYKENGAIRDNSIKEILHEIKVLQQLQDAKAKNINPFFEAFQIHSQLWIVNDHCPGGSIRTLMNGTGGKLEEKYIIPIARELAIGLKAIHDAGIIHRDLKAGNIMIHEKGLLQIIDFGVSGVLQTSHDKRSTVIGTPHWMPPELHKKAPPQGLNYGTEVDVWAYGCTLYEIAVGRPPFARIEPGRMLGISQTREPPRLKQADHSAALCDLVAYVLQPLPANRPSMETVLHNAYIEGTEESHPTVTLADLVKRYYQWEQSGGQRQSLFMSGGAKAVQFPDALDGLEEEWNFSTTANFDQQFAGQYLPPTTTTNVATAPAFDDLATYASDTAQDSFDSYLVDPTVYTPVTSPGFGSSTIPEPLSEEPTPISHAVQKENAIVEDRVQRGGRALQNLFDMDADPYTYSFDSGNAKEALGHYEAHHGRIAGRVKSDLPLRDATASSSLSRKELEVTDVNKAKKNVASIDLANVNTIKAHRMNRIAGDTGSNDEDEYENYGGFKEPKRATMGWTFDNAGPAEGVKEKAKEKKRATKDWSFPASLDTDDSDTDNTPIFREPKRDTRAFVFPQMQPADDVQPAIPKRPALVHAITAPVGEPLRSESGLIDLDALMMTTSAASGELDLMRAAFNDEEPTITARTASTEPETTVAGGTTTSKDAVDMEYNYSASSTDDEGDDTPFDPLSWKGLTDDEITAAIDQELTAQGILDPMIRGIKRREYLKQHKEAQTWFKQDVDRIDLEESKNKHSRFLSEIEDFPGKDHILWDDYDPQINLAPTWPKDYSFGQKHPDTALAEILRNIDADSPKHSDTALAEILRNIDANSHSASSLTQHEPRVRDIDAELRALGYPDPIPPSAAAMAQDAPDELLIGEATRLLKDMMQGLEVGKKIIKAAREQMENEREERGEGDDNDDEDGDGDGDGDGEYGGHVPRSNEGSDAGAESD